MTERERLTELILNAPKIEFPFGSRAQGKTYQTAQNIADHLLSNGVIVLTDDLIFILTAIAWGCSSNEALSPCATYYVNNELLGKREILISEALYRFDQLLLEIADRRADNEQQD